MSGKRTLPAVSQGLDKSSPAGANGVNRGGNKENWVQCDKCQGWELFENSGIGGRFDQTRISKVKFQCRMCGVSASSGDLEARIAALEQHLAQGRKSLDEGMEVRIKAVEERLARLESRFDACFGDMDVNVCEVLCKREDCEMIVAVKVNEATAEMASKVEVCDVRCEDRVSLVNRQVNELSDKLTAFELKARDLESDAVNSVGRVMGAGVERVLVSGGVQICTGSKLTYAEKVKARGKGTVFVLGDSLVRGVGKKLEAQCGAVFSTRSIGGARIEGLTEEVRKLEAKDDRHLVVMVGTNNIQEDGSEVVLRKFSKLIECCKSVKNRAVTIVGIPRRFGVTSLQENRRSSVNVRLSKLCRDAGVQFVEYEADRSRICQDRVHFNEMGQREVAGMIFRHCRHFLL